VCVCVCVGGRSLKLEEKLRVCGAYRSASAFILEVE
jgi:hypothetical protein